MVEYKESKFYKLLQDFFINNNKETFIQMLGEFYNRTEGIIIKNDNQDNLIKELREMYIKFNEEGIDENIVREKVNYFINYSSKIENIVSKLIVNTNNIEKNSSQLITKANLDTVFSMANMGQDIKEAMTGGSVAVVGENMVLDVNIVDKQVNGNKTTFVKEIINLFIKETCVDGIVSSVNGTIIPNTNFVTSDFIRLQKGRKYVISSCYDYAFYNDEKVFVRGVEHPKAELTYTHNSDTEKYIRYTIDKADIGTNMMCENYLPSFYVNGGYGKSVIELLDNIKKPIIDLIQNNTNTNKLKDKVWNCLGDSITEHNGATTKNYHDFIKEWTSCKVNNYGISGTGYTETTSTPNNRFIQRVSSMDSRADIITVFGGINDFYFGTKPIGRFGDKTSDTFYGCVDELILALINKFPTKTIAVFTPLISTLSLNNNSRGESLNQYVQAIIEVCNYYAIPVLDLNKVSGLNPNIEVIKNNYIPDGTHPNANGHKKIAYKILSFLESL